jgi:hypothetical protein
MNWLKYIGLALTIGSAIPEIQAMVATESPANPLTAGELNTIVQPIVASINSLFPKSQIPQALASDCAAAVVDVINRWKLHITTANVVTVIPPLGQV